MEFKEAKYEMHTDLFTLQRLPKHCYWLQIQEVDELSDEAIEQFLQTLTTLCAAKSSKNTIVIDTTARNSVSVQTKFFVQTTGQLRKMSLQGVKKLIIISTSAVIVSATNFLTQMAQTESLVAVCSTSEEGWKLAQS